MVGPEGFAGAMHLLGPASPNTRCMMQMAGRGYRLPFGDLKQQFDENGEIRTRILELVQGLTVTLAQVAACNKLHDAEERLARWLLMAQDRVGTDTLVLTQEFIAEMLGTRRSTVALVAGSLQRSGLIEYHRGTVKILSRSGLEETACECYGVIRKSLASLYQA